MSETRLHKALRAIIEDLQNEGAAFALVGGLAVSARTEPRFTRDLDLAVHAADDRQAEALVSYLLRRGYRIQAQVEQHAVGRLATVRLKAPGPAAVDLDLLFASSMIEPEIVREATPLTLIEGLTVPVASLAHLIATKVLARDDAHRPQDHADLVALLAEADAVDLEAAREALRTIHARGAHRGKDLLADLEALLRAP